MNILKYISIYIMSILYIYVGINHFIDTKSFLIIIPPYLQTIGLEIIYLSGIFEIILGILLIIPKYRKIASYGIILLLIAVYPSNIYLAFNEEPQNLMGISSFMASWVRLPLQFVFLGLAYWHSKDN